MILFFCSLSFQHAASENEECRAQRDVVIRLRAGLLRTGWDVITTSTENLHGAAY
jgi:hypothetical protein